MPIYEYECSSCDAKFQCLIMKKDQEEGLVCPECGGKRLNRLISRVSYHVSEQDRIAAYDDKGSKSDAFYRDTRNIGLHAKKRARRLGVDLGDQFETRLEKLRTDPGSVIKDSE